MSNLILDIEMSWLSARSIVPRTISGDPAMYMSWSDPGNFHTLYNPSYEENYCPGLDSKVAVCLDDKPQGFKS